MLIVFYSNHRSMTTQQQCDDRLLEILHEVRFIMEHINDVCHQVALKTQLNVPPLCNNTQPTNLNLLPLTPPAPLFPSASPKPNVPFNPQTTHSTTQQPKHAVNHEHHRCIIRSSKRVTNHLAATPFSRISLHHHHLPTLPISLV